ADLHLALIAGSVTKIPLRSVRISETRKKSSDPRLSPSDKRGESSCDGIDLQRVHNKINQHITVKLNRFSPCLCYDSILPVGQILEKKHTVRSRAYQLLPQSSVGLILQPSEVKYYANTDGLKATVTVDNQAQDTLLASSCLVSTSRPAVPSRHPIRLTASRRKRARAPIDFFHSRAHSRAPKHDKVYGVDGIKEGGSGDSVESL
ncbi:hypothetical protein R3P38DRAFT_2864380, partial [Favolaschia claudopus]